MYTLPACQDVVLRLQPKRNGGKPSKLIVADDGRRCADVFCRRIHLNNLFSTGPQGSVSLDQARTPGTQ